MWPALKAALLLLLEALRLWKQDREAADDAARRAADQRASDDEAYRETTQRMQDAEPDDTDPGAIRARLRNRPRGTR